MAHLDLFRLTCSELQHQGSSLKETRDIWWGVEGTELSGFGARDGGASFSQTEVLVKLIVPLLRTSMKAQMGTISEFPLTLLTLFSPPW